MQSGTEEHYRLLIELSPDMIAIHNDGKFLYINQAGATFLGASQPDQLLDKSLFDFIHPAYIDLEKNRIQQIQKGEPARFIEEKYISLDEKIVDVEVIAILVTYQNQSAIQIVVRDISERKLIDEELKSSEKRFKTLFEFAPDGYYLIDLKGNIIDSNKALGEISGYNKEELIGKNLMKSDLISPDENLKVAKLLLKNKSGHSAGPEQFYLKRKDNTFILIEIRTFPIRIKSQPFVLAIARDISERNQAKERLQESEERFRQLSEATFEGIVLSQKDKIIDVNLSLANMLQYDTSEIIGKNILDFIAPRSHKLVSKNLLAEYTKSYEALALRKDGLTFPIELFMKKAPYRGGIIHILAIRNIAERKRIERLHADTERIIRHDLKSPLNAIIGFSDLLLSSVTLNKTQSTWLNNIQKNGHQMLRMIDHSLDLFKMEEGTYSLRSKKFNFIKIFNKLHEEFINYRKEKSIDIKYYLNEKPISLDQNYTIIGEHYNLENLFANLFKNALEAAPDKSNITVKINEKDAFHSIDIHNFGTIPEEIRDRFFERYVTSGKRSGTGLGTYSALLIAKSHGGNLTFLTSEKDGTHLIVTLPK